MVVDTQKSPYDIIIDVGQLNGSLWVAVTYLKAPLITEILIANCIKPILLFCPASHAQSGYPQHSLYAMQSFVIHLNR